MKEQLLKKFAEEAFSANAFEADEVLNDFLTRDVLAWGDQLLAEDAANKAMAAANAATSAEGVQGDPRAEADVQKPEGGEAADAAANVADGAAVADRVAVETTNAAVADAAAALNPAPQERGPPAGEPTASEGVDGELPLCLNDVSSQTANSYNQMTIKTHGHVVYDFEGKKRTINLQDLTDFACMKKKKRSEVKQICASVYFLQDLLTIYPRGPHGRRDPLSMISSPDYERTLKQIKERTIANAMDIEYQSFDALRVDSCDEDEPPTDGAPLEEPKGAVAVDAAFVLDERGADDAPSAMETDPTLPNFELPTTTNVDLQEIINNPVQYNNSRCLQRLLRLSGRDRNTADEIRRILPELRRYTAQTQNHELQHLISKFEASASTGSSFFSRILNSISSSVSSLFSSSVISSTESLSKEAPAKKKQLVRQARLDQGLSSTVSGSPLSDCHLQQLRTPDRPVTLGVQDLDAVTLARRRKEARGQLLRKKRGRGGDVADPVTDGSLAGSSVEVSPARSQDSEDEDEDDGNALGDLGELERTLAIKERAYGSESNEVAITLNNLGTVYYDLGDYAKQRGALERALPIMKRAYGSESKEVAITLNNLGAAYSELGDYAKALDVLEPALAIRKRAYGSESNEVAITLDNLGHTYNELGDHTKARDVLEPALAINEQAYGRDHTRVATTLNNLGHTYNELGDHTKARYALEHALPIFKWEYGSESKEVAITLVNLGEAHIELGDAAEACKLLQRALAIFEENVGHDHVYVAFPLRGLGNAHRDLGDAPKSLELLEQSLAIFERHHGQENEYVARTRWGLGKTHVVLGDVAAARSQLERVVEIYEAKWGANHRDTCRCRETLASLS